MWRWPALLALALVACERTVPAPAPAEIASPLAAGVETCASAPLPSAELAGGARVEVRPGDVPGESDLWLVPKEGPAAPIAPAPGPDEHPIPLPGGRVAFVSGRTTVASLWIADLATGEAVQLTNRGLEAGGDMTGFVPPPAGEVKVEDGALIYDDGYGNTVRVALPRGAR